MEVAAVVQPMRKALAGVQFHPRHLISLQSLAAAWPVSFQGVPPRVCELLNMAGATSLVPVASRLAQKMVQLSAISALTVPLSSLSRRCSSSSRRSSSPKTSHCFCAVLHLESLTPSRTASSSAESWQNMRSRVSPEAKKGCPGRRLWYDDHIVSICS